MERVKNTIVITGGAQGIGHYLASHLSQDGYEVIIIDNDTEALEEFSFKHPDVTALAGDVSETSAFQELISKNDLSNLIGVINNAAISENKSIEELSLEEWNRVLSVNLTGVFLATKYLHRFVKKNNGSIINICSTRALMSEKDTEAYSASKGGVLSLTHSLAISLGPDVRVNSISPGWIEVSDLKKSGSRQQVILSDEDMNQHPVGRVGHPNDIYEMVKFLLSEKSGFITGQNFVIDGGMTKKMIYY